MVIKGIWMLSDGPTFGSQGQAQHAQREAAYRAAVEQQAAELKGFRTLCIDGVSYLQFKTNTLAALKADGSVRTCTP